LRPHGVTIKNGNENKEDIVKGGIIFAFPRSNSFLNDSPWFLLGLLYQRAEMLYKDYFNKG